MCEMLLPPIIWLLRQSLPNSAKNFNITLSTFNPPDDYQQPRILTFHNLCKSNILPIGARALLGQNLKFCLAHRTITNDLNKTMLKMAWLIRI